MMGQRVFGLTPEVIEECDLPGPEDLVGDFAAESEENQAFVEEVVIPTMREKIQKEKGERRTSTPWSVHVVENTAGRLPRVCRQA
jgi:hypothetical protein